MADRETDIARVLDRARKLVALAASDHAEEARTSAHLACALIRAHGLLLVAPGGRAPAQESLWDDAPPPQPQPPPSRDAPMDKPRRIVSKFPGRCLGCAGWIDEGETVLWKKGRGAAHEDCAKEVSW